MPEKRRHRVTPEAKAILREQPATLDDVHETFRRWLYLPDPGIVTVTLGAVAANLAQGDPVWLLLIGPPGSGKTETLDALLGLPHMHAAGVLTEAGLLSAVAKRERANDASGGLLRSIGDFGFVVAKDFTTVLSMARETRTPLLAALREIHDGHWTRHVGTDGGRALSWRGKCALIGGCTGIIDQHHAVMAAMGERFLLCRLPSIRSEEQAQKALSHVGHEDTMRRELRSVVSGLFAGFAPPPLRLNADANGRLAAIATLVAHCRSAVERDSYRREIDLIPGTERPARLVLALARLFHGMWSLGAPEPECWRLVTSVAFDCIPDLRRRVFQFLRERDGTTSTTEVSVAVDYPTNTTRRALEDLAAHQVVTRYVGGSGKPDRWEISLFSRKLLQAAPTPVDTVPEASEEE